MCPKSSFLKCVEFPKMAIFALFGISDFGTRKVSGNFRQKSRISGKFHAKFFAEIGCIFATYRKPEKNAKKRRFSGNFGVFQDFRGRLFSGIYRFTPILPVCTCCAECSVKTPKMHKLFGISNLEIRENFFRAVFRRFPFFRNFRISGNRTKFEIYIVHC
jgi:hypothetical protein